MEFLKPLKIVSRESVHSFLNTFWLNQWVIHTSTTSHQNNFVKKLFFKWSWVTLWVSVAEEIIHKPLKRLRFSTVAEIMLTIWYIESQYPHAEFRYSFNVLITSLLLDSSSVLIFFVCLQRQILQLTSRPISQS